MRIAIGCDRKGLMYKNQLVHALKSRGYEVIDVGTHMDEPCDYPIYAQHACAMVVQGECEYAVLLCATGIGISIAANKVAGIRCGVAYTDDVAMLMREHNDANAVAFGASFMAYEDIERRTLIFFNTSFIGRHHTKRIELLHRIEKGDEL